MPHRPITTLPPITALITSAFLGLTLTAAFSMTAAAADLTDPYEILERHYEAVGGLELLKAESTAYYEGGFSAAGLTGTIKNWYERPGKSRTEIDLEGRFQVSGDNGEIAWDVDMNGKLRIERDERALKLRELGRLMEQYEHLNRESEVFTVIFEGIEDVDGVECYVVGITNTKDEGQTLRYFDTSTFLEKKSTFARGDRGSHTFYSDYREVGGITKAFRTETHPFPIGSGQTSQIHDYQTNIEIDSLLFDPPEEKASDFTFVDGADHVEIPFTLIEGHIYLPVTVNCDRQLWVLDSGAGMSVIDSDYAGKLGLELSGAGKAMGAGQEVDISFATVPSFSLPGVEFDEQNVIAIEIAGLFKRASDAEVGGLLGYDFLSRFVSRVDYANETITLYEPKSFSYEGDGTVLDAPLMGPMLTLPATLDGEYSGKWMLDLGAGVSMIHYPFAEENGLLEREGITVAAMGAGGRFESRASRFETMQLGGHTVAEPIGVIPTSHVAGAIGNPDLTGTMGYNIFRHFVLTLDYERQQVIVEPGDDFDRVFPDDRSGIMPWRTDEGEVAAFFVVPGSPAYEAGFREGDVLTSINGIDMDAIKGLPSLHDIFREKPGTTYTIVIDRDGESMELTLTLRELL